MILSYRNVDMLKHLNVLLIETSKFKVSNNSLIKLVMGHTASFKCTILEHATFSILMCSFNMYLNTW